jgi:hypothetical protein
MAHQLRGARTVLIFSDFLRRTIQHIDDHGRRGPSASALRAPRKWTMSCAVIRPFATFLDCLEMPALRFARRDLAQWNGGGM